MGKFFDNLLNGGIQMVARTVLKVAGAALVTWLAAKHVDPTQATNFANYLSGAALTGLGMWLSQRNLKDANAKNAVAASAAYDTGKEHALQQATQQGADTQAANDNAKLAAVADAMATARQATKTDKASVLSALKTGSF